MVPISGQKKTPISGHTSDPISRQWVTRYREKPRYRVWQGSRCRLLVRRRWALAAAVALPDFRVPHWKGVQVVRTTRGRRLLLASAAAVTVRVDSESNLAVALDRDKPEPSSSSLIKTENVNLWSNDSFRVPSVRQARLRLLFVKHWGRRRVWRRPRHWHDFKLPTNKTVLTYRTSERLTTSVCERIFFHFCLTTV
jgi:hypothetical protein